MLPKDKRLNLSTDFKWVSSGKAFQSEHFRIFCKLGENKLARVGVAVASKHFPKAVERNRAKRILFHAFEKIYKDLPSNSNILTLPKPGIDNVKSDELQSELKKSLEKIT